MKQREIEQRVRTAVEHAAPGNREEILSACDRPQQAEEILLPQKKKRFLNPLWACAATAVIILFVSVYFIGRARTDRKVDAVVMLDVNPSFSLSVNAKEQILSVEALNTEAEEVLGAMELSGVSLEVAINALIGSMLQNGYLDDLQNSILVSVENDDSTRGERLREKVASTIDRCMNSDDLKGAVLSQTVSGTDKQLKALSEQYHISLGKAALIQELVSQDATLRFEDLAGLSVNEIALISTSKDLGADSISQTGTVSDKAYIGKEEALSLACAQAGVSIQELTETEIEFDSEKGIIIYEVEFRHGNTEYEYDIDARTGDILKQKIEDKTPQQKPSVDPDEQDALIGEAAAKAAALTHAGLTEQDITAIHASLEYDDGKPEAYEVEFRSGSRKYEYDIHPYTGAILSYKTKTDAASSPDPSLPTTPPGSYIGEEAAKAAAFAHAGINGNETEKLEIEFDFDDDSGPVYEIEFKCAGIEYEYEIDARSGAILQYESDWDD